MLLDSVACVPRSSGGCLDELLLQTLLLQRGLSWPSQSVQRSCLNLKEHYVSQMAADWALCLAHSTLSYKGRGAWRGHRIAFVMSNAMWLLPAM